jgi:hypothetical protein
MTRQSVVSSRMTVSSTFRPEMRRAWLIALVLAACVLLGYGAYVFWLGMRSGAPVSLLYGASTVASGVLMLARKDWARFLVYLVVSLFIFAWSLGALIGERSEVWSQQSILTKFVSLAPGLGMIAVALACAFIASHCLAPKAQKP